MSKVSKGSKANNKSGKADKDVTPPQLPPNWDRCHAYNQLRRRFCRQMPVRSSSVNDATHNQPNYCGNHAHLLEEWLSIHGQNLVGSAHCEDEKNEECSRKIPRMSNHPNNSEGNRKKNRGKRVPCPIDPTHLIFEGSISKHILVCPAEKRKQEVAGKEYFCEGINLGGFGDMGSDTESMICDFVEIKKLAYSVLQVFNQLFLATYGDNIGMLSIPQLQNITEKDIYDALPENDLSGREEEIHSDTMPCTSSSIAALSRDEANPNLDEVGAKPGRLSQAITKHRIRAGGPRHLRQIASILGHVRSEGLIAGKNAEPEKKSLVVEVGAGRGMTGLVVAGAMGASMQSEDAKVQLCLVERAGTRGKAESRIRMSKGTQLKDDCLRLDLVDVTRVRCDLAHVDITKALGAHRKSEDFSKTVVIAKHLCGAGTDLALKSIRNLASIDGCIFATCCHGLCNWNDYVGRDCLLSLFCSKNIGLTSFGENQFNLMKRWASASVERPSPNSNSPSANDQTEDDHPTFLDDDNDHEGRASNIFAVVGELGLACGAKGLGRACQRLIDYGRCDFMRNALLSSENHSSSGGGTYNVRLLHYVPRDVTPQNALIIATRERYC